MPDRKGKRRAREAHIYSFSGIIVTRSKQKGRIRRKKVNLGSIAQDPPKANLPIVHESPALYENAEIWQDDPMETSFVVTKPHITKTQNDLMNEWLLKSSAYMDALLEFEDLGVSTSCGSCKVSEGQLYRCRTCLGKTNYCQNCLLFTHRDMPLHRIAAWNVTHNCFQPTSLASLGLILRLAHPTTSISFLCLSQQSTQEITVVHSDGFHNVQVQYCSCPDRAAADLQLFKHRLFPASQDSPRTAFSFELLQQCRYHHLEGKGSAYKLMNALYRLTDDVRPSELKDRVRELRRVLRQWNFLQISKLTGYYARDAGFSALAVACPACPHPGQNMSEKWQDETPEEDHWLGRQYMHVDANFHLTLEKREKRAAGDVSLCNGDGFFVDQEKYTHYLAQTDTSQRQVSDCVDYRAITQNSRSRFNSLEVTGVVGAVCRHDCPIRQSFVDLYKGERYVNTDYALSSAFLQMQNLKEIILSYDIACQYSRHFRERFASSQFLQLPDCSLIFLIPKLHLAVHKTRCQVIFSFNHAKGVGRTDGEGIERLWSTMNYLSGSTSRMTPGSRRDTLNDHLADWNWKKGCKMAETLNKRLQEAQKEVEKHSERFHQLCESLSDGNAAENWIAMEENFVPSLGQRTIYELATEDAPTQASILQQLSNPLGGPMIPLVAAPTGGWTRVALWINDGLKLEDAQRALSAHASTVTQGDMDLAHIKLRASRMELYNNITSWRKRSPINLWDEDKDDGAEMDEQDVFAETIKLPLPFTLSDADSQDVPTLKALEKQLRIGQAHDALKKLRRALGLRLVLNKEVDKSRGQREHLRSASAVQHLNRTLDLVVSCYRAVYTALDAIGLDADTSEFRPLTKNDLRVSSVFESDRGTGRGRFSDDIPWIWKMHGVNKDLNDNNWLQEVLRVQFLDAKANKDRWVEEVQLVKTELIRTQAYFRSMSEHWNLRSLHAPTPGDRAHSSSMKLTYLRLAESIRL